MLLRRSLGLFTKFQISRKQKYCFHSLIPASELIERQAKLISLLHQKHNEKKLKLLLIPSANRSQQADTVIPSTYFKQCGDFIYLTGLTGQEASNSVFAILAEDEKICETYLFTPLCPPTLAIWEGHGLRSIYLANKLKELNVQLKDMNDLCNMLLNQNLNVFTSRYTKASQLISVLGNRATVGTLSTLLDEMRVIKSKNEMNAMRRTCSLGVEAMEKTMKYAKEDCVSKGYTHESVLASTFNHITQIGGARKPAYPLVVAGNDRATIIHYGANCNRILSNQWVLMDAGCEDLDGYNSDITRNWRVDGQQDRASLIFALNQALVETHKQLIKNIQVNETSLNSLLFDMLVKLGIVLKEFGIISRDLGETATREAVSKYCPHHVSHYLGLDVHDSPSISRHEKLQKGMCFTVEPGLYFRPDYDVKKEFRGIGLRIEDDLIINENNELENLTQKCTYFD